MMNSLVLLIARLLLMALFLYTGLGMIQAPANMAAYFASLGLPLAPMLVWLVIALKLIAAIALTIGFYTRCAAYALAFFSMGAALIAHLDPSSSDALLQLFKDFSIAGGLLALTVTGPGALSIDKIRSRV